MTPNVREVDRAARFHATFAATSLRPNTLSPLRSNDLLAAVERNHLFLLALQQQPVDPYPFTAVVSPALQRILESMGGGFACVVDGDVRATVPLPYGGLISPLPAAELVQQLRVLDAAVAELGCTLDHPCMTLSFLSLSVIPSLKLTDQGLIDVETFKLVPLQR